MAYERELTVARAAVVEAAALCRRVQAKISAAGAVTKEDRSPVTVADFGAQALVARRLKAAFGSDPLVAEEASSMLRADEALAQRVAAEVAGVAPDMGVEAVLGAIDRGTALGDTCRYWVLDPVDGTKGFLRGEQYAVALALIDGGEVVLGVLGCPNLALWPAGGLGCLFTAVRGAGAWQEDFAGGRAPVSVSPVAEARQARFCESVEAGHSSHGRAAEVARRLGITEPPCRIDSQCKYGVVARGEATIYLRLPTRGDYVEKVWDHAAGSLVVSEAGGRVSDLEGNPLDFRHGRRLERNRGVLATNARVHDEVLEAISSV